MRLESYAQEFEDLFLFALLHDVQNGFYIDVGANDPVIDSVTKFFYDRGWHGINIEPVKHECLLLEEARERDINLCIGLASKRGEAFLYESPSYALSTFSKEIARESFRVVENGAKIDPDEYKNQNPTPILTLTDIFETYVHNQIHFCKIDVEGLEKEVLLGVKDWQKFRPWTFCIESTIPTTEIPTHEDWEYILLEAGYQFVTMYGVNRYYVDSRRIHLAKTHAEIISFLSRFDIRKMQMSPRVKFV